MMMKTWFRSLLAVILFLLSGALFAFALPPRDLFYLALPAFVSFLTACRLVRPSLAILCTIPAAVLVARILVGPFDTLEQSGNAVFIAGGLAGIFSLTSAFASFAIERLSPRAWVLAVPCVGVTGEYLIKSFNPASVAMTQHNNAFALNLSTFTGTWGVSFLVWLLAALIVASVAKRDAIRSLWPAILIGFVLAVPAIIPQKMNLDRRYASVVVVQASDSYTALQQTEKLAHAGEIVLWPELLLDDSDENPMLAAKKTGSYVIADIHEKATKGVYNTAILVSPEGKVIGKARKQHLFGKEAFDTLRGVSHSMKCGPTKIGIAICYDAMYNDVCRRLAKEGAKVFFVPSLDPQARSSVFNYLHGSMMAFRSAENRTPLVWADANGLSTVFDDRGKVIVRAPTNRIAYRWTMVGLRSTVTFFTRFGDWFAYLCIIGASIAMWKSVKFRKKQEKSEALRLVEFFSE